MSVYYNFLRWKLGLQYYHFHAFLGDLWNGYFWHYGRGGGGEFDPVKTRNFRCLSVQGR